MKDYFTIMTFDRRKRQHNALQRVSNVFHGTPYIWYGRKSYKKARWRRAEMRALIRLKQSAFDA
jgi:hypothetical protein